jgi:hypothetical protein
MQEEMFCLSVSILMDIVINHPYVYIYMIERKITRYLW